MTHRPFRRLAPLAAGLAAVLLLAGCDLGPDWMQPRLAVPAGYRDSAAGGAKAGPAPTWPAPGWWRGFRSPELDRLIAQAEQHNFDIAAAVAQIRAADAAVRISGSPLLPSLSGTSGASWQQAAFTSRGVGTGVSAFTQHSYDLGLNVAYEADFWGKNRASFQAAKASAVASRYTAQTVALTAVTAVAQTWFTALAYADRLRLARQNLKDAESTLAVIRGRLDAGTATALDLARQEALVNGVRANIPALQNNEEQELIGLGILTGRPPEQVRATPGTLDELALPPVAPGLPAALLRRRPDVAAAEAQLVAANFDIKAARAAFFPTIALTGQRGYQSAALETLFTPGGIIASLAANLTQPVFNGGLLRGQLEQSKAQYRPAAGRLPQGGGAGLHRCRYRARRLALHHHAGGAGAPDGGQRRPRCGDRPRPACRRHGRCDHGAQHGDHALCRPGHPGAGAADPVPGAARSLQGTGRRLASPVRAGTEPVPRPVAGAGGGRGGAAGGGEPAMIHCRIPHIRPSPGSRRVRQEGA